MRVVAISDTHNRHKKLELPDGDVLIHAGDATSLGKESELLPFAKWLNSQPHKHKIFVPGNHDIGMETDLPMWREDFRPTHVLVDQMIELEGVRFYGSPWSKHFSNYRKWAFSLTEEYLKPRYDAIPACDVLITHGPPLGMLDATADGYLCGSWTLRDNLPRIAPKHHVFGHIHEAYGEFVGPLSHFHNVAQCDLSYQPVNKPQVFEVNPPVV